MNWWILALSIAACIIEIVVILRVASKRPEPQPQIVVADEERKIKLMAYNREAMRHEARENDAIWSGHDF